MTHLLYEKGTSVWHEPSGGGGESPPSDRFLGVDLKLSQLQAYFYQDRIKILRQSWIVRGLNYNFFLELLG
jgi:hypothetical protein